MGKEGMGEEKGIHNRWHWNASVEFIRGYSYSCLLQLNWLWSLTCIFMSYIISYIKSLWYTSKCARINSARGHGFGFLYKKSTALRPDGPGELSGVAFSRRRPAKWRRVCSDAESLLKMLEIKSLHFDMEWWNSWEYYVYSCFSCTNTNLLQDLGLLFHTYDINGRVPMKRCILIWRLVVNIALISNVQSTFARNSLVGAHAIAELGQTPPRTLSKWWERKLYEHRSDTWYRTLRDPMQASVVVDNLTELAK